MRGIIAGQVIAVVLATAILALLPLTKWALGAPHAGDDPAMAPWFESQKTPAGSSCCNRADCYEVPARSPASSGSGLWQVYVGEKQFGRGAPNKWLDVPDRDVKFDDPEDTRPRPLGAVACWAPYDPYAFMGESPTPDGHIICFRPPRVAG